MQQIMLQYLVSFKNHNYLNLKVQVIELRYWCKSNSRCTRWICEWIIMY